MAHGSVGFGGDWGRVTKAERDAAYNNSNAVANSPALNQARIDASAAARQAWRGALDLPYGGAPRQCWDLFPSDDPAAPCLAFIHGGYWQRNRREDFCALGAGLRAQGWSIALPGYTLAPEATLTQIVAEIRAALDWLQIHGVAHGIAGRVLISGWSAGGHLAAMVLDHPHVAAGLAISGVYELGPIRDTYLNEKLRLTDEELTLLSPLRLPPVRKRLDIAYGTQELPPLVGDSRDLHALRAAAHCEGALLPVAGTDHFTVLDSLSAADGLLAQMAINILGEVRC